MTTAGTSSVLNCEIVHILKSTLGLKINAVGRLRLEQAVRRRMRILGLPDEENYVQRLKNSLREKSLLVEEVVIPETWFFRDGDPFVALLEYVRAGWDVFIGSGLRILSIPCSTGEEPYSIAMCLLDAGFPQTALHIDAVDISARSLESAQLGVFGRKSFRGDDLAFRDRHFKQVSEREFAISDTIKERVGFARGNILSQTFPQQFSGYHIIFCKNVLIYLSHQSQGAAIRNLNACLRPNGMLFTSPAETALFTANGFRPHYTLRGYTLTKPDNLQAEPVKTTGHPPAFSAPAARPATPPPSPAGPDLAAEGDLTAQLNRARMLADSGRIGEAGVLLDELAQKHKPAADLYYLMGLIRDVQGDFEAAAGLLRKAIYLDPRHVDSITVLAYLSRRLGDEKGYSTCMQRLERLEEEGVISNEE